MPKGSTPGNKTLLGGSAADECDLEIVERLINQIKAVCKALKYIRSVTALDTLPHFPDGSENPKYTKWCRQMGIAGRARVDVEMAAEYQR